MDDIIAEGAKNPSMDPDDMGRFVDDLIDAEDMDDDARSAFCAGYMAGMAHALGIVTTTRDCGDIVGEMMSKEQGWALRGLL